MPRIESRRVTVELIQVPCCGDIQVLGSEGHEHTRCRTCKTWYDFTKDFMDRNFLTEREVEVEYDVD